MATKKNKNTETLPFGGIKEKIYSRHNQRFLYKTKRNRKRTPTSIVDWTTDIVNTKEQRSNQDKHNRRRNRRNWKLPTQRCNGKK